VAAADADAAAAVISTLAPLVSPSRSIVGIFNGVLDAKNDVDGVGDDGDDDDDDDGDGAPGGGRAARGDNAVLPLLPFWDDGGGVGDFFAAMPFTIDVAVVLIVGVDGFFAIDEPLVIVVVVVVVVGVGVVDVDATFALATGALVLAGVGDAIPPVVLGGGRGADGFFVATVLLLLLPLLFVAVVVDGFFGASNHTNKNKYQVSIR
jgi:hypothetical protein